MAGIGPMDLPDLAADFLSACEAALNTIPTLAPGYGGSPARAFVSIGPPAFDCDQLTVHVGPLGEGSVAARPPGTSYARVNHVTLVATVLRCVPGPDNHGKPPSAAVQQAASVQSDLDKWALWNHLYNRILQGLLFDRCGNVQWGPLSPVPAQGLVAGCVLTIRVSLDGYDETIGS